MSKVKKDSPAKSVVREYVEAIAIALLLALFIRTFIVQAFKIPSGSMIPSLLIGDHLLVNKFMYGVKNPITGETWIPIGDPQREDIIVFKYPKHPEQDFIKRVIGLPGDRVTIIDKEVFVNGEPLNVENAISMDETVLRAEQGPRDNYGPVEVPADSVFVMGDNRDNSHDSRFWGFVDYKLIKGKAFILYWSWDREASLLHSLRWQRLGSLIH